MPVSQLSESDFETGEDGIPVYTGDVYETRLGIDVSFYQGDIDWQAVADAGIEFAMIRCGYRGSSEGELFVDAGVVAAHLVPEMVQRKLAVQGQPSRIYWDLELKLQNWRMDRVM